MKQFSKDDLRYWQPRIAKRKRKRGGKASDSANYYVRIQFQGLQRWVNLETGNKAHAAHAARDAYQKIKEYGWDVYGSTSKPPEPSSSGDMATVGEFIEAVRVCAGIRETTFHSYEVKFRRLVAQVMGLYNLPKSSRKREDGTSEASLWRQRVESVPLDKLDPKRIRQWMLQYVKDHNQDPVSKQRAIHTVNATVRNAKALFSEKHLESVTHLELPETLPFEGIKLLPNGSMRYRSKIDPAQLLEDAKNELQETWPESYKAFVLCLLFGLRRKEADRLLWKSVDLDKGVIHIERTAYFDPKSEHALGSIPLSENMVSLMTTWKADSRGPFVINSHVALRMDAPYGHYRANLHFKRLVKWLRDKDVENHTPIHTLRKEYGRLLTEKYGIYGASRGLRHGSIQITAAHYADDTRVLSTGLEHSL